jgi:hypothetical protein
MPDIIAAADEFAATKLVHDAEASLPPLSKSGSGNLGPFTVSYNASASFSGGSVSLSPPNIIHLDNVQMHYSVGFTFSIDLNDFLPSFCLPQVCIPIPFDGDLCTPKICITWPTISVPVSHSGTVNFSADFALNVHLSGGNWLVDIVVVGIPFLQIDAEAAAILAAIGAALSLAMLAIPFIGPFLAAAVAVIVAAISIAGVTGLLGPILTPFVSGLTFTVYKQPQLFQVLPPALPDAAVNVNLDLVTADVESSDKNELVINVNISA